MHSMRCFSCFASRLTETGPKRKREHFYGRSKHTCRTKPQCTIISPSTRLHRTHFAQPAKTHPNICCVNTIKQPGVSWQTLSSVYNWCHARYHDGTILLSRFVWCEPVGRRCQGSSNHGLAIRSQTSAATYQRSSCPSFPGVTSSRLSQSCLHNHAAKSASYKSLPRSSARSLASKHKEVVRAFPAQVSRVMVQVIEDPLRSGRHKLDHGCPTWQLSITSNRPR